MMMRIPPHTSSQTVWIGKGHDQVPIKTQIRSYTCFGEIGSEGIAHPRCRGWECVLRVDSDVGQTRLRLQTQRGRVTSFATPCLTASSTTHPASRPLDLQALPGQQSARGAVLELSGSTLGASEPAHVTMGRLSPSEAGERQPWRRWS